jgi:hypothetical protein
MDEQMGLTLKKISRLIKRLQENESVRVAEMRRAAHDFVIAAFGEYMYPGIRDLPFDQPIRVKPNLQEMGCDGGFDPIPPQQIEFDASLTPLERLTALLRAAIQFYAYSGPAELPVNVNPSTRWGFLHLDQTGAPNTRFYGLQQDMVRYLTDAVCDSLHIGSQTWMQRGDGTHIRQLITSPAVGEERLLRAFFGEAFPELYEAVNQKNAHRFDAIADLSDQVDNAQLCEFTPEVIQRFQDEFTKEVLAIE